MNPAGKVRRKMGKQIDWAGMIATQPNQAASLGGAHGVAT